MIHVCVHIYMYLAFLGSPLHRALCMHTNVHGQDTCALYMYIIHMHVHASVHYVLHMILSGSVV